MVSSAPSRAGALKVGRIFGIKVRLAGFAGLLAWRFFRRVLPAASPWERFAAVSCAVLLPPYSRAAATACLRPLAISAAHRLPVHEACGYGRGRFRPLWVIRSRALLPRRWTEASNTGFGSHSLFPSTLTLGRPFTRCSTVSCV